MLYSEKKIQLQKLNRRAFFLLLGKLSFFSILSWRLFNIQIKNSKQYQTLSTNNQIDVKIIYPVRGLIMERSGKIVATNLKVFDLYIIPERIKSLNETLNILSNFVDISFERKREIIKLSKSIRKFEKITIIENLSWKTLEAIEANKNYLPGVELIEDFQRIYPENEFFSHLLGYVNKPSKKDLSLPYISNMPLLNIGQQGIEKTFNEI